MIAQRTYTAIMCEAGREEEALRAADIPEQARIELPVILDRRTAAEIARAANAALKGI
jgi:hypothetical protein